MTRDEFDEAYRVLKGRKTDAMIWSFALATSTSAAVFDKIEVLKYTFIATAADFPDVQWVVPFSIVEGISVQLKRPEIEGSDFSADRRRGH